MRACLLLVLAVLVSAKKNDIEKEIENIRSAIDNLKYSDVAIDKYTSVIHETLEKMSENKAQQAKAKSRLKDINTFVDRIQRLVMVEQGGDEYLKSLPTSLLNTLMEDMKNVTNQIAEMKTHVSKTLEKERRVLESVHELSKSRNVVVAGVQYYGEVGGACLSGNDICKLVGTECRDRKCQCKPGLSFNSLRKTCVRSCPDYGSTYQTVSNYIIRGHNNVVKNATSLAECKRACQEAGTFTCKSFDWFPRWHTCYISEQTRFDVEDKFWEFNSAAIHFQRDCMLN